MINSILLLAMLGEVHETTQSTWVDSVHDVMHVASVLIGIVGVAIVVWGVLCGAARLIQMEVQSLRQRPVDAMRETIKEHLGFYLLLGLEFLVAADIIETLIAPTSEHLILLAGIVVIRTIISVSLNWELSRKINSAPNE